MHLETSEKVNLEHVVESVRKILEQNFLLSLSTYLRGSIWTSTVFYSYDKDLNIYFVSDPNTRHSKMLGDNPNVSAAIYSTNFIWGTNIQGIQLQGNCIKLSAPQTLVHGFAYLQRFPIAQKVFSSPEMLLSEKMSARLFQIKPTLIQLYDEVSLSEDDPIQRIIFD